MEIQQQNIMKPKESRDTAVTVRLPKKVVDRLKKIAGRYNRSQSEVIEHSINILWESEARPQVQSKSTK